MIVELEAYEFAVVSLKASTLRQKSRGFFLHLNPDLKVDVQSSPASGWFPWREKLHNGEK